MITVVAKFQAQPGKEAELQAAFEDLLKGVREKEAGSTLVYALHTLDSDPAVFLFYEQYASAEAFAAHGQTEHMRALFGKLGGLLAGRPVIERYTQIAGL